MCLGWMKYLPTQAWLEIDASKKEKAISFYF